MANSLITRCPKCSTAFRVSDDVLSMAKGKVRCGQCFHIFDATKVLNQQDSPSRQNSPSDHKAPRQHPEPLASTPATQPASPQAAPNALNNTQTKDEEIVNPDWLDTLFTDEDLQPPTETFNTAPDTSQAPQPPASTPFPAKKEPAREETAKEQKQEELAPWELELAEVEAALSSAAKHSPLTPEKAHSPAAQVSIDTKETSKETLPDTKLPPQAAKNLSSEEKKVPAFDLDAELNANPDQLKASHQASHASEPDYMSALHSLAQTAAEETRPSDGKNQHSILEQLSAQESLAPLLEDHEKSTPKKSRAALWFLASILGLVLLAAQVGLHFFDEGSRSANFRAIYQSFCSYTGCSLPGFEDIEAISIQHVRIQSHPSIANTLLVNAIITNTSAFSQPMPKIALEFFDLNGLPVAARLFAPNDYLHKDFLDITYMPPNTPIHLVIPIQDPAARAVTHQLRAFPSDTRSY
ncbi:zinc-ribbon domain-containing protein [Marinomonas sp. A79]|uniref:Zinc-ribbon domain-containing protein n=1 Tax=Marinomonas vulgaris TaxID=2823372 RepID=A0ABS5HBK0_9GAMM|nr:zinc-ribbon and DUF3426 domain-containing protein [Marinomonas vulgaris]MBR7889000.1 zinc-ribbon domain-containing protein [Marinomonas vulgaris]